MPRLMRHPETNDYDWIPAFAGMTRGVGMIRGDKIIKFRAVDGNIFQAIIKGKKKIEMRVAIPGYMEVKVCDMLILVCAN